MMILPPSTVQGEKETFLDIKCILKYHETDTNWTLQVLFLNTDGIGTDHVLKQGLTIYCYVNQNNKINDIILKKHCNGLIYVHTGAYIEKKRRLFWLIVFW